MTRANQLEKRVTMGRWMVVKYQLLTHCYLHHIATSEAELDCLTSLAIEGEQDLTDFCRKVHRLGIFSCAQSVRNCLNKSERKGLISKKGKNRKRVFIHPDMQILSRGNILLEYKILSLEAT